MVVPAIMMPGYVNENERRVKSLDIYARHDKRRILFAQDCLMDFLIEEQSVSRPEVFERLIGDLDNQTMIDFLRGSIQKRDYRAEQRLVRAIETLPCATAVS